MTSDDIQRLISVTCLWKMSMNQTYQVSRIWRETPALWSHYSSPSHMKTIWRNLPHSLCFTCNTVVLGVLPEKTNKLSRHMSIDMCCTAEQECSECSLSFKVLLNEALTAIPLVPDRDFVELTQKNHKYCNLPHFMHHTLAGLMMNLNHNPIQVLICKLRILHTY